MKTNDYLLITATTAYSYLFYHQNAGINFLVFNLIIIFIMLYRNKQLIKQGKWLWAAAMCLISATAIFINSSALAIIANVASLLLLSAFSFSVKTSALVSFAFSVFSVVSSVVYLCLDLSKRWMNSKSEGKSSVNMYRVMAIVTVFMFALIFFALYQSSNPLFATNTKWINLDFISVGWVMFTLVGFLISYALMYHRTLPIIENYENELPLVNRPFDEKHVDKFATERFAGNLLFVLLNLMLVILNVGDIQTIWLNGVLPQGLTHSDFVHNGVGILIFSIVLAAGLIMFLYRNNFKAIKNSNILKILVYLWILQNLIMLVSTAARNQMYIEKFNLTDLRIGVYVWLVLAMIGLCLTFIKVYKEKSNWYLVRSNVAVWFCVLSLSSLVNWDVMITRYNLANKPLKEVDLSYLLSMSNANLPELLEVVKRKDFPATNEKLNGRLYRNDYIRRLANKAHNYVRTYETGWQSYDLRDQRIMNAIKKDWL